MRYNMQYDSKRPPFGVPTPKHVVSTPTPKHHMKPRPSNLMRLRLVMFWAWAISFSTSSLFLGKSQPRSQIAPLRALLPTLLGRVWGDDQGGPCRRRAAYSISDYSTSADHDWTLRKFLRRLYGRFSHNAPVSAAGWRWMGVKTLAAPNLSRCSKRQKTT